MLYTYTGYSMTIESTFQAHTRKKIILRDKAEFEKYGLFIRHNTH